MFLKKSSIFQSCESKVGDKTICAYRANGDIWVRVSEGDKVLYKTALVGGDKPGKHTQDVVIEQDGPGGLLSYFDEPDHGRREKLRMVRNDERTQQTLDKAEYKYQEQRDDEKGRSGYSDALDGGGQSSQQGSGNGLRNPLPTEMTLLDTQGQDGKGDMDPKEYGYKGSYGGAASMNYLDDLQMEERSRANELKVKRKNIKMRRR